MLSGDFLGVEFSLGRRRRKYLVHIYIIKGTRGNQACIRAKLVRPWTRPLDWYREGHAVPIHMHP